MALALMGGIRCHGGGRSVSYPVPLYRVALYA